MAEKNTHSSLELEEVVLGSLLLHSDTQDEFITEIKDEIFTASQHRIIFQTMRKMYFEGMDIDVITLTNTLKKNGRLDAIGGVVTLAKLTDRVTSNAHTKNHILFLKQLTIERKLLTYCNTTIARIEQGEDVLDIMDKLVEHINDIYIDNEGNDNVTTTRQAVEQVVKQIEDNRKNDRPVTGIPTGFYWFDQKTGGLQEGNLIVIAGESSQGKTSLALSITYNATMHGFSGAYYSLEMGSKELAARLLSMNVGNENIKPSDMLYKRLDSDTYSLVMEHTEAVSRCQIYFDERVDSKLETIVRSIKMMKAKFNIQFAVVDYLQIMTATSSKTNKEGELAEIARELKNTAKREHIPIILLSQLARDKQNPEPTNARLRGSGQIEEASDLILLVYRPEVYGLQYSEPELKDKSTQGTALIKISKGRNTGVFNFLAGFNANLTKFYDLNPREFSSLSNQVNMSFDNTNTETDDLDNQPF